MSLLSSSFPISEAGPVTPKTQMEVVLALWYPQGLLAELELESGSQNLLFTISQPMAAAVTEHRPPAVLSLFPGLLFLLDTLNLSRMH